MQLRQMKYSMIVLFLLVMMSLAVGQSGVTFMTPDAFTWYRTLARPTWTPPDYVFPVVWTVAYLAIAISAWLVWREKKENYGWALSAWFLQLILNGLWTPLFFGYHQIRWSFVLMVFYAAMALLTTVLFYKHHKLAGFLMTLYLGWIIFAGALNYFFWQLN
ncbi:MAG: TspO/MBR family protein [Gammaproteobacteria bacterium]|nr:TspO/MBR family protein [Gammaproteobacteria bacterium]